MSQREPAHMKKRTEAAHAVKPNTGRPRVLRKRASDAQTGIESIETGMRLLLAFREIGGRSHQLKVLAEVAGMPPSKAHRYLVSLIRMGFVDRDATTGRYRLGPKTIELGAAALDAMDAVALSVEAMIALHDELDHTMALSVWGSNNPVIVRVEEADRLMTVGFRVGKSLPLLASAAGLLFSAFLPHTLTGPLLQAEVRANKGRSGGRFIRSMVEAERLLAEVRSRGLARIAGDITPGINALGAPVLDHRGYPVTVISAIGPEGSFDSSWNGTGANAMRRTTQNLSRRIGFSTGSADRKHLTEQPSGARAHPRARPGRGTAEK
jgi:DNA-binding IclR family transcriptional regulator